MAEKMLTAETNASCLTPAQNIPPSFNLWRSSQLQTLDMSPGSYNQHQKIRALSLSSGDKEITCLEERISKSQRIYFCVTDFPHGKKKQLAIWNIHNQ